MDSFDIFWNTYDNKKSKDKCQRKWFLMPAKDQQACMDSLPSYIASTPDKQFRKHPATYLNNRSWNDKIYSTEDKVVLSKPKQQTISTYEPKEYPREKGVNNMREKLIKFFNGGEWNISDVGDIYTSRLKPIIPPDAKEEIVRQVNKEANTPRKNRFEDHVNINVKCEIRDRILRRYLYDCRDNGIKVYENIE